MIEYARQRFREAEIKLQLASPNFVGSRADAMSEIAEVSEAIERLGKEASDRVFGALTLDELDRGLLWLGAACQMDARFRELIARANDNVMRDTLDLALAQQVLCGESRDDRLALYERARPGGALHASGVLKHVARGASSPLHHELVVHGDVVATMIGAPRRLSEGIERITSARVEWQPPRRRRQDPSVEDAILRSACSAFFRGGGGGGPNSAGALVLIRTGEWKEAIETAHQLATLHERGLLVCDVAALEAPEVHAVLWGVFREGAVHGDLVLFVGAERLLGEPRNAALLGLAARAWTTLALCALDHGLAAPMALAPSVWLDHPLTGTGASLDRRLAVEQQVARMRLPGVTDHDAGRLARMPPANVDTALRLAGELARLPAAEDDEGPLGRAIRTQLKSDMGRLAVMSQPDIGLDDVVLEDDTRERIEQVVASVRNRHKVLHGWNIAHRIRRGIGICCLFDGDPGTGKTLAAEAIAGELDLTLFRIEVSNIVDKYIGETEKHLAQIFERAQPDTSILLFDEADALFSKRTEVSSSKERYANMSVNVLLQLIEAYEGTSILTTNLRKSIDPAFERRIMFRVTFEMPAEPERLRLWRYLLPSAVPTSGDIDYELLSEIAMSGGQIKNAILAAAYEAARGDAHLTTEDLREAAYREVATSGTLVRRMELE